MLIIYSHLLLYHIVCFGEKKVCQVSYFCIISFLFFFFFFLYKVIGFQIGEVALLVKGCCCSVASVMSDFVQPHRWQPTRLLCPWDSPGKNTGVGCHFLPQCTHACMLNSFSHVWLCATPWTVALQAPLSIGFSRQQYWSRLPFPSP